MSVKVMGPMRKVVILGFALSSVSMGVKVLPDAFGSEAYVHLVAKDARNKRCIRILKKCI